MLAWQGDAFTSSDDGWRRSGRCGTVRRLVSEVGRDDLPLQGVVTLWAPDAVGRGLTLEALERAQAGCSGARCTCPGTGRCRRTPVVTRGAQAVAGVEPDLAQAPVGTGRHRIGIPGAPGGGSTRSEARRTTPIGLTELQATGGEDRVHCVPGAATSRLAPARRWRIIEPPARDHRAWNARNWRCSRCSGKRPGGRVEIRVVATGLNFRDVLNALGMYPGDPGPLGNECAGVITAIGSDGDLRVGEVIAMVDQASPPS